MSSKTLRHYAPLLLVVFVAAALRLYKLEDIDVRFDEASAPQLALSILNGNWLRVAPFSGSVANHPPLYLYTLAFPYLFTRDFLAIAAFRVLLDVTAVGVTWLLCAKFFNLRVAFIAALLFAVAPWAVQYARKTWLLAPPLHTLVWFWGICVVLKLRDARGWFLVGLGLALSIGSHLVSIYLLPVTLVAVLLSARLPAPAKPHFALAGVLPLALLALLYLGHDAGQNFANTQALFGAGGAAGAWTTAAAEFALWGSGGAHLSDLTGAAYPLWLAQMPAWGTAIDALQMGVLLACLVLSSLALLRRAQADWALIVVMLLWQVLPVLLQSRSARPLQMHYLVLLWPGAWMLMALVVDRVLHGSRSWVARAAVTAILGVIVAWQLFTTLQFAAFVGRQDTAKAGYGEPVRAALAAVAPGRAAVRSGRATDVIVVAPGGNPAVDAQATVLDVLLADTSRRFVRAEDALILRGEPMHYVFAPDTQIALERLRAYGSLTVTVMPGRAAAGTGDYTAVQMTQARVPPMRVPAARWENGARLIGYRMTLDGASASVVVWLSIEARTAIDQHWFVRVQDATGTQLGARDIGGVHPSNWRVGDVLALYVEVPIDRSQAAPAQLRIGSYAFPVVKQTMVLDVAGNPADDGVTVPVSP